MIHIVPGTYFFHAFKCSKQDCSWHKSLRSGIIEVFGEPVPTVDENNTTHYVQGCDPKEQYIRL